MKVKFIVLAILLGLVLGACTSKAPAQPVTIHPAAEAQGTAVSPASQPAPAGSVSFAKDVMPIFEASCVNCHGGKSTKAGLDLSNYAATMAGSVNGVVIVPKKPNYSYLLEQVVEGEMPRRGKMLSREQIQILWDWVASGALNN